MLKSKVDVCSEVFTVLDQICVMHCTVAHHCYDHLQD